MRFVVEHVLFAAGYAVDSVSDAATARERLGLGVCDIIPADGKRGDGNSFEITDLGARQRAKALIIIGCAMAFPKGDLERYPYLMKPVKAAAFAEMVRICGGCHPISKDHASVAALLTAKDDRLQRGVARLRRDPRAHSR